MVLFTALVLLATAVTAHATPQFDKYLLLVNASTSQTCIGSFTQPLSTTTVNQYSDWIEDFQNLRFRFTVGTPNLPGYRQLLSFSTISYVITFDTANSSLSCYTIPFTFQNVLGAYSYRFVRYLGDATLNNQTYRMFAGFSPDPVTLQYISNVQFVDANTSALSMKAIIASNGFNYYSFSNVTIGTPDASWFTLPSVCGVSSAVCSPPCGSNAQCVSQTCVCYDGYTGNATDECVANVSVPQPVGAINIQYDQFLLQSGADAVSQTCLGYYINPLTGLNIYSGWIHDVQHNAIRWDIGVPGAAGSVTYYFYQTGGYTVTYLKNNAMICDVTNQLNYSQVFTNLFYPTMRYMGFNVTYNNVSCRVYAGTGVPNPYSAPISMIKYISTNGSQFYFLALLNNQGYTYFDYPNVTLGTPATSWFSKPPDCSSSSSVWSYYSSIQRVKSAATSTNSLSLVSFITLLMFSFCLQYMRHAQYFNITKSLAKLNFNASRSLN